MCGLAGFVTTAPTSRDDLADIAARMAGTLVHRGPDDEGVWADPSGGVALAFRRLAILDLSAGGHQPMLSSDGRFAVVFNGEIYNFQELRAELEGRGVRFRGRSDTEVIVEAACMWGARETINRLWGMFAIALWDGQDRSLLLARDRLGKKPLYIGQQDAGLLLFGSELKALRAHPSFRADVDRDALAAYFQVGYVPAPLSIYRGVSKLEPGCLAVVRPGRVPEIERYWDLLSVVERGVQSRRPLDDREALDELEGLLTDAVARRMVADVPLGALLSGGVDSSIVAAYMQRCGTRPARTFTIGFEDPAFDEAPQARAVARHLGTDHTELVVTASEAREVIPTLPDVYDEPFADSSQIPTLLVSALARRSVTVALSGDGGDEVFGGYVRYLWGNRVWNASARWPRGMRRAAAWGLGLPSDSQWRRIHTFARRAAPSRFEQRHPVEKIRKLAAVLDAESPDGVYRRLTEQWPLDVPVVIGGELANGALGDKGVAARVPDFVDRMMYYDLVGYLPGDILTKVDRASMRASLEVRGPLLDHRLVEWAWSLPASMKLREGVGKWLLRQALYRHVPRELIERPKTGFGVPIGDWLKGPLRPWAEALLAEDRLRREGFLRPEPIRRIWRRHLAGERDEHNRLWTVLMFQAWLERWQA